MVCLERDTYILQFDIVLQVLCMKRAYLLLLGFLLRLHGSVHRYLKRLMERVL